MNLVALVQGIRLEPNKYRTFIGMAKSGKDDRGVLNHLYYRGLVDGDDKPKEKEIEFFNLANRYYAERCWRLSAGWREFGITIMNNVGIFNLVKDTITFSAVSGGYTNSIYRAVRKEDGYAVTDQNGKAINFFFFDGRIDEY